MSIEMRCPVCGKQYRLRDEMAGKDAKCKCGATITIPAASASPQSDLENLLDQELSRPAQQQSRPMSVQPSGFVPPAAGGAPHRDSSKRGSSKFVLWVTLGGVGGVILLVGLVFVGLRLFGGGDAPTSTASGTGGGSKTTSTPSGTGGGAKTKEQPSKPEGPSTGSDPSPVRPETLAAQKTALAALKQRGDVYFKYDDQRNLIRLELSDTKFINSDLQYLKAFPKLKSLTFYGTHLITDDGLEQLIPLENLRDLTFFGGTDFSGKALVFVGRLQNLQSLRMVQLLKIDAEALAHLARLKKIRSLRIYGMRFGDAGLAALQPLASLETLVIGDTGITNDGLKTLKSFGKLRTLSLEANSQLTDDGIALLQDVPTLEFLHLGSGYVVGTRGVGISNKGLLGLSLPNLKGITLADCRSITSEGIRRFQQAHPQCKILSHREWRDHLDGK